MPSETIRKTILFFCTGNYYRSRFAELLFNHLASQNKLEWIAISRGLALERGAHNIGPISKDTVEALAERGVSLEENLRLPNCSPGRRFGRSKPYRCGQAG